jgi:hypothetical protein
MFGEKEGVKCGNLFVRVLIEFGLGEGANVEVSRRQTQAFQGTFFLKKQCSATLNISF